MTAPISTPSARMTLTAISATCTGNSIRINPTTNRNSPENRDENPTEDRIRRAGSSTLAPGHTLFLVELMLEPERQQSAEHSAIYAARK